MKLLKRIMEYLSIIRLLSTTHVNINKTSSYTFEKDPMSILVPKVSHNTPIDVYKL